MKLGDIYKLAVQAGIDADPRGKAEVKKVLSRSKDKYAKMTDDEKEFFDIERLDNPYADTRILVGDPELIVTGILAGVDLEVPEVLLAERLNERGSGINLLLTHHPEGKALAALADVMGMQADMWHKLGVPINIGESLIDKRIAEVSRAFMPMNHNRSVDAARLLGFAYMSVHTPADNLVEEFVSQELKAAKPETVRDVVEALKKIPEYRAAAKDNAGPTVVCGSPDKRAGKVVVDMTGGTEPPEDVVPRLAQAGLGTWVTMHVSEKLRKKAEENMVNVVVAGHIASDAIGLNRLLDRIESKRVSVIATSGLMRVRRS